MSVILFELADGAEDPRPAIPEFLRFAEQLDVVGSYDLFGAARAESAVR